MSTALLASTAEAICSALHQIGFEFLGEPTGGRGGSYWRAPDGDPLAVQVLRAWEDDEVLVALRWRNAALAPRVLVGQQDLRIKTNGNTGDTDAAAHAAVHRVLEVYREVVAGTGVASADYAQAHMGVNGST